MLDTVSWAELIRPPERAMPALDALPEKRLEVRYVGWPRTSDTRRSRGSCSAAPLRLTVLTNSKLQSAFMDLPTVQPVAGLGRTVQDVQTHIGARCRSKRHSANATSDVADPSLLRDDGTVVPQVEANLSSSVIWQLREAETTRRIR